MKILRYTVAHFVLGILLIAVGFSACLIYFDLDRGRGEDPTYRAQEIFASRCHVERDQGLAYLIQYRFEQYPDREQHAYPALITVHPIVSDGPVFSCSEGKVGKPLAQFYGNYVRAGCHHCDDTREWVEIAIEQAAAGHEKSRHHRTDQR